MKTLLKVCFSLASLVVLSSPGSAAEAARYRIDLQDGTRVYARDLPVRRGTVFTFHQHPGGALTGVPAELVLRIEPGSGEQVAAPRTRPKLRGGVSSGLQPGQVFVVGPAEGLKPGEVLVLGPTGEGGGNVPQQQDVAPGNGFPATSSPTTIGPDGFPVLSPGVPGSSVPGTTTVPVLEIGPNGTPVLTQPGAPQPIGPNGTPVLAPPGAPGSAAPSTAPNGTPAPPPAGSAAPPSS